MASLALAERSWASWSSAATCSAQACQGPSLRPQRRFFGAALRKSAISTTPLSKSSTPQKMQACRASLLPVAPGFLATPSAFPVLAACCTVPSLLGLWKSEYTVSYGYGLAIALSGLVMLDAGGLPQLASAHAMCLVLYGLRLVAFLGWRECNIQRFKDIKDKLEAKAPSNRLQRLPNILGCSLLYLGMVSPVVLTARYVGSAPPAAIPAVKAALAITLIGWLVEAVGDFQKSYYKAKNGPGKWVREGLFSVLRHPNYTGEQLLWAGSTLVGMFSAGTAMGSSAALPWLGLSFLGFAGIQLVLTMATTGLERRQGESYGSDPEFQKYRDATWAGFTFPPKKQGQGDAVSGKEKSA
eukprot:jgi/Mesvir1/27078/Mv20769-RA.1